MKQRIYFFNIWKKTLTYTSFYLNITSFLRMFLTFRYIISSLSSVSKEIICDLFPLHTHAHTHTHTTHTHIHTNTYSFSFVMALDVVCNFSQTKGLSGNQASNKISSNDKKQKATSVQFRTKKTIIF